MKKPTKKKVAPKSDPYRKAAATERKRTAKPERAVRKAVKAQAGKMVQAKILSSEIRLALQKETDRILWTATPEMAETLVAGLRATKVTSYGGAVMSSDVPDHFLRMQAADRIAKLTVQPIFEDREMRQQIIIYQAIGGVYAERLARARARMKARGVVPMPDLSEILTPSRMRMEDETEPHE